MGLSGFVPDLVIPGLIMLAIGLVLAMEFDLIADQEPSALTATVIVTTGLVASYLAGIAVRHSSDRFRPMHDQIYHDRLMAKWAAEIPRLEVRWLQRNPGDARADSICVEDSAEVVRLMREYYLSTSADAWAGQIQYSRDIARVAANSALPLGALAVVEAVSSVRRGFLGEYSMMAVHAVGLAAVVLVLIGLRQAHRRRLNWTVDAFVRTDIGHSLRAS